MSNFSIDQLWEANKDGYVDVLQSHYNLLHRKAEQDLLPYTREHGISFVPYFPLGSGLLGGKYRPWDTFRTSAKTTRCSRARPSRAILIR